MAKPTQKNSKRLPKIRQAAFRGLVFKNGWYVLPSRGGVVTRELIQKIQEELDRDEALRAGCPRDAAL